MDDAADRLRKARADAGFESATDAARALGVSYQTYVAHENGSRGMRRSSAISYAQRFKVSLEWLLTGKRAQPAALGSIPVIGKVAAGDWVDVADVENADAHEMPRVPASADYPLEWQYAFTVAGTSINKIARDGDRLVCLDLIASGVDYSDGDLVIIERVRHDGQMVERTAKRVRRTTGGYDLCPESHDESHQAPIAINGAADHECIRVKALVLWVMRRP